jgi:hypothetical protein
MDEVLANLLDGDLFGRALIKLAEMPDASQVGLLGAGLEGKKLQVIGEGIKAGVRGTFFIGIAALS